MVEIASRMTLDEFLALPERKPALEFEEGVVTQKVSPKGRHSTLQSFLATWLNIRIAPQQIGFAFTELRVSFAGMSRVPDVAVYRWDRIPRDAAGRVVDDFFEPPDIAIEIVPPKQSVNRLFRRCLSYVHAGVRAAVLVDPSDESVLLVRPGRETAALRAGETLDLSDIIPDLRLGIAALFEALKGWPS